MTQIFENTSPAPCRVKNSVADPQARGGTNRFLGDCQFGVFSRAMISRMRAFWLSDSIGASIR